MSHSPALERLSPGIRRPAYAAGAVDIGIVHLGIGAFHRAHQAIYTDDAIACAGGVVGHLRRQPALA